MITIEIIIIILIIPTLNKYQKLLSLSCVINLEKSRKLNFCFSMFEVATFEQKIAESKLPNENNFKVSNLK